MLEPKFIKFRPYGKLHLGQKEYFLASSRPLEKDSWATDAQQMWSVVPISNLYLSEPPFYHNGNVAFHYARAIVVPTALAIIELCNCPEIELETYFDEDEIASSHYDPQPEPNEDEMREILAKEHK